MIQRGDRARFQFESAHAILIERQHVGNNFDRHIALQARVAGAVDFAHAACADQQLNFVGTKFGSRR